MPEYTGPVLGPSAHADTFCRDNLPPPEQWPEFVFDLPELSYPARLNCAAELLDATAERLGAGPPLPAHPRRHQLELRRAPAPSPTRLRGC